MLVVPILASSRLCVDLRGVRRLDPPIPTASVLHQPECKNVGGRGKVPLGHVTSFSPGDRGLWNDSL